MDAKKFEAPGPGLWSFESRETADAFDAHVREQLPWYDLVLASLRHLAWHYVPERGRVIDVGASTGNFGCAISDLLTARQATLLAVEKSAEMASRYAGPPTLLNADLTEADIGTADFIVSNLCLMFLPASRVTLTINRLKAAVNPGGALVIVEKFAPGDGYLSTVLYRLGLSQKIAAGAALDDVMRKEMSLAGVQRPLLANSVALNGFSEWFRFGDFRGLIWERPT